MNVNVVLADNGQIIVHLNTFGQRMNLGYIKYLTAVLHCRGQIQQSQC